MASTFTGLNISSRGLYSSQTALYVSNANISNASNSNYTCQKTTQEAVGLSSVTYQKSVSSGSVVTEITRQRSSRYDTAYRETSTDYGEWYTKSKALTEVEGILDEPSDASFSGLLTDFQNTLESLSENPESTEVRSELLESGQSLCTWLNETAQKLSDLQNDLNDSVSNQVDSINEIAQQVAQLNGEISRVKLSGGNCNTLLDQQDALLDELAEITDVTVVRNDESGDCQVLLGGYTLVKGSDSNGLSCVDTGADLADGSPAWTVQWEKTGKTAKIEGGALKGNLDMRDGTGDSDTYNGVPSYLETLNETARNLARLMNTGVSSDGTTLGSGHEAGYGLDGTTGLSFFTYDDLSTADFKSSGTDPYGAITALNIGISADLSDNPDGIAASDTSGEEGNNEGISSLIDLLENTQASDGGTIIETYNQMVSTEGAVAQNAVRQESYTAALKEQALTNRESLSSVSLDEESVNLVQYQKIYEAASKMISVWKEIYETTIQVVGG